MFDDLIPSPAPSSGGSGSPGLLASAGNVARGAGERVGDLMAGVGDTTIGLLTGAGLSPDNAFVANLRRGTEKARNADFGYEEATSWDDFKSAPLRNFVPFALEQGLVSLPDMAAAVTMLPAYVYSRTGELADRRAENNGIEDATVGDLIKVLPAAVGSALLERFGARGAFGLDDAAMPALAALPDAIGRAAVREGATEAGQGQIDYAATNAGTEAGWNLADAGESSLQGAVGGAGFGGAARAVAATGQIAGSSRDAVAKRVAGVPVSTTTLPADIREARKLIQAQARETLADRSVRTLNGDEVLINWQGIKHAANNADRRALAVLPSMDRLLETSDLVSSEPDSAGRADIRAVHRYASRADIDGAPADVMIFVREHRDGRRFYDHAVLNEGGPSGTSGDASASRSWSHQPAEGPSQRIGPAGPDAKTSDVGQPTSTGLFDDLVPMETAGGSRITRDGEPVSAPGSLDAPSDGINLFERSEPFKDVPPAAPSRTPRPRLTDVEQTEVVDIVRRVSGLNEPQFMETIRVPTTATGLKAWGRDGQDGEFIPIAGFYDIGRDAVTIALDVGRDAPRVAYHESFHRLQNVFLNDAERTLLESETEALRAFVASDPARADQAGRMAQLEIEAEAFALYSERMDRNEKIPLRLKGRIRAAWDRIRATSRRVRNYLQKRGYQTFDDVFDSARSGETARRAPASKERPATEEWSLFPARSGTINVPRSQMPQVKAEHRGALTNFAAARGISHEAVIVPADTLRATQAEFSRDRVEKAKERTGGDRAILVSSDWQILDGHHQWLAAREAGEDVRVIRFDAPIGELLDVVREFPSSTTEDSRKPESKLAELQEPARAKRERVATVAS